MKLGSLSIWISSDEAQSYGCTHYARMFGIVPGFAGEVDGEMIWVSRSDLFNWLEDSLSFIAAVINELNGDDPAFSFKILSPIKANRSR